MKIYSKKRKKLMRRTGNMREKTDCSCLNYFFINEMIERFEKIADEMGFDPPEIFFESAEERTYLVFQYG